MDIIPFNNFQESLEFVQNKVYYADEKFYRFKNHSSFYFLNFSAFPLHIYLYPKSDKHISESLHWPVVYTTKYYKGNHTFNRNAYLLQY